MMNGIHLIADLYRCQGDQALFLDLGTIEAVCFNACREAGLSPVGKCFHSFTAAADSQGGVTGVVVLAESHLAIHTWPETRCVTIDLYVCNFSGDNTLKARALFSQLTSRFQPGERVDHEVTRGALPHAAQSSSGMRSLGG